MRRTRRHIRVIRRSTPHSVVLFAFILMMIVTMLFMAGVKKRRRHRIRGAYPLSVLQETNIPVRNIVGIDAELDNNNWNQPTLNIHTLGSTFSKILVSQYEFDNRPTRTTQLIDFENQILNSFALCGNQAISSCHKLTTTLRKGWKSLAVDGENLYVMNESLASIIIYRRSDEKIVGVINLEPLLQAKYRKLSLLEKGLRKIWKTKISPRGMIFKKDGNILVLVQIGEHHSELVEFGITARERDENEFYRENELYQMPDNSPLSNLRVPYTPQNSWSLPAKYSYCSVDELKGDSEENIYVLSKKCRIIARINPFLDDQNELVFNKIWQLPKELGQVHSFAVVNGHFIVAEKAYSYGEANIFLMGSSDEE